MTTSSTNTRIRHDSDANFREWAQEFHDMLAAIGAVQTADTGQINLTTVVRAGTNADAGYELWYVNDSLHGTAPIYFKIYYGTGAGTSRARLRIEVGTGSNGTGTLTGGDAAVKTISYSSATDLTTDTTYQSYACMARGALWIAFKCGRIASEFALMGFFIGRGCDATGAADDIFNMSIYHNNGTGSATFAVMQRQYRPTAAWVSVASNYPAFFWPAADAASTADEDGNVQFMIPFIAAIRPRPLNNILICWDADVSFGSTYSLTGVGSTAFTYIALKRALGAHAATYQNTTTGLGMLLVYE